MKLMEHDTVNNREKLENIWDSISGNIAIAEMENRLRITATQQGVPEDDINRFLIAGDI